MLVDDDESSNDEESIVLEGSYYGEWAVSKGHGKWRQGGFLGSIHEHVSIYLLYIKMSPALRTKYGGLDSEYVRGCPDVDTLMKEMGLLKKETVLMFS